jgi:hypothetical protein
MALTPAKGPPFVRLARIAMRMESLSVTRSAPLGAHSRSIVSSAGTSARSGRWRKPGSALRGKVSFARRVDLAMVPRGAARLIREVRSRP